MNEHEALRERHNRLRLAAQAITTDAREGDADHSLVPTHLVRLLERELRRESRPSAFQTMSPS
jgi:hypothetical protein